MVRLELLGFRDEEVPAVLEFYVHQKRLNMDADQVTGYVRFKEISARQQNRVLGVRVDLVQQEVQGSTKSHPTPYSVPFGDNCTKPTNR